MAPLPRREQRYPFLRYQGLEYSDLNIADFEERLERIHDKGTHRVQVLAFEGMAKLMRDAWSKVFETRGLLVRDLILEFLSTLRFGEEGDEEGVVEEAPMAPGGGDKDEEMPQAVPPPPRTQVERIARLEEEVHGMREVLQGQIEVLDSMAHDFSRTKTISKFSTIVCEYAMEPSTLSKSRAEVRRDSVYKSVEARRKKSNLKTSL
nr:hypothetical protein [Tanacetum cinerariifolium]